MERLSLEDMQKLAKKRGGNCLSNTYVNRRTCLEWECSEGHRWKARADQVKGGSWCRICEINRRKDTIEEMRKIAEERGGKCLSNKYVNATTPLLWECAEGHQWKAVPYSIKNGTWCRKCKGLEKSTIEDMQKIAEERGGKCLSETYFDIFTPLQWECSEGHRWEAQPSNVKRGTWCRICAHNRRRDTMEDMRKIAEKRGGKCLSTTYANSITPLVWECEKGHRWEARPSNVKRGEWCAVCSGKAKMTLDEMRKIAEERGGKCLSDGYINRKNKLLWECREGHRWEAQPGVIKFGQWCPECSTGLGERICRTFFEQVFREKFPASYPRWLINNENNQMELDGYCRSLRLAFEHHGEQHYSLKTPYVKTEEQLRKRQADDKLKREVCSKQGVVLIEIPHVPFRLPLGKVREFIKGELLAHGITLPVGADINKVNLNKAYITSSSREVLEELKSIAKEHGGKCLSDTYVNGTKKLLWECSEGHNWEAIPKSIAQRSWCKICVTNKQKGTLQEMKILAEKRAGKCLSDKYVNANIPLLWECSKGHQWWALPSHVKNQGHWCHICGGTKKLTIKDMHNLAKERGGRCISDTYANNRTKLLWECADGHQWWATPNSVKDSGQWCYKCACKRMGDKRRDNIENIRSIAKKRGGKCLSTEYLGSGTKLLWECDDGHQWWAIPSSVKRGHWCPKCAKLKRNNKLNIPLFYNDCNVSV
jgi:REP element-mobilizing transposase RayT